MTSPESNAKATRDQIYYPTLHLFYHLGISGQLLKVDAEQSSKWVLCRTDEFETYRGFSLAEKFMFLLQTLCMNIDWLDLVKDSRLTICDEIVKLIFRKILSLPVAHSTQLDTTKMGRDLRSDL